MVTIAHIVKKKINESHFIQECIIKDIVSYAGLAESLQPLVEQELGEKVKTTAIMMAIRRHSAYLQEKGLKRVPKELLRNLVSKTNVMDICIRKNEENYVKIRDFHKLVDREKGEFVNIIEGDNEIVIVTNESCLGRINNIFNAKEIKSKEMSLVSISLKFQGDFLHTPGVIYSVLRELAWHDINIYEVISTNQELNLILGKKDFTKAYTLLTGIFENE